jgi:hypothetical protein
MVAKYWKDDLTLPITSASAGHGAKKYVFVGGEGSPRDEGNMDG